MVDGNGRGMRRNGDDTQATPPITMENARKEWGDHCAHLEHIGDMIHAVRLILDRYGDELDAEGDLPSEQVDTVNAVVRAIHNEVVQAGDHFRGWCRRFEAESEGVCMWLDGLASDEEEKD